MQGQSEICIFGFGVFLLWFAIEKPLWLKLWCLCSYEAKLKKKMVDIIFQWVPGQHQKHWWGRCDWCCSFSVFFSICPAGSLIIYIYISMIYRCSCISVSAFVSLGLIVFIKLRKGWISWLNWMSSCISHVWRFWRCQDIGVQKGWVLFFKLKKNMV